MKYRTSTQYNNYHYDFSYKFTTKIILFYYNIVVIILVNIDICLQPLHLYITVHILLYMFDIFWKRILSVLLIILLLYYYSTLRKNVPYVRQLHIKRLIWIACGDCKTDDDDTLNASRRKRQLLRPSSVVSLNYYLTSADPSVPIPYVYCNVFIHIIL